MTITRTYDIAIIGAGVIGCAIARQLAASHLSVALLEARCDVGDGTSKANTAILHTGFDATPGTLESRLVARGYEMLTSYAKETGIAVEHPGAVLVAWEREQQRALPGLADKASKNGYDDAEVLGKDAVYARLPALGPGALGGLAIPDEAIIDPWSTTLALATDALNRGADLRLNASVTGTTSNPDGTWALQVRQETIHARWVINAAGLNSDLIDRMFGRDRFTVTPRRGELLVFDKQARPLAPSIVLPVPTARGKGVLVSPTIFGNVMLGPTAEDLIDRGDTSTSSAGLAQLLERGRRIMPALLEEEVTATYAGLRAATEHSDYVIDIDSDLRYACLGGIRSTGLTASLAIAEHVAGLLEESGLDVEPRADLPGPCTVPNLGEAFPRPYQRDELIAHDPQYGRIVCFCERVTRGEIRDAMCSPVPPHDLDGLRRRTRALMGRCQGFFCGAEIERLFEEGSGQ